MRIIKFSGHSDDCFEIEGSIKDEPDEIGCFNEDVAVKVQNLSGQGLIVYGIYSPHNWFNWMFGIALLDEDIPIPEDWKISYSTNENGYSPTLTIECSDDAFIYEISR